MKKITSLFAVSLMAVTTASAINPVADLSREGQLDYNKLTVGNPSRVMTKVKKASNKVQPSKIESVADIAGSYEWVGWDAIANPDEQDYLTFSLKIEAAEDNTVYVYLVHRPEQPIEATVDLEAGTLTLPAQEMGYNTSFQTTELLVTGELGADGSLNGTESIVGTIADGAITFPEEAFMGLYIENGKDPNSGEQISGWFFGTVENVFTKADLFVFNPDEWTLHDSDANYKDGWVNPALKEQYRVTDPYPVEVYRNKENSNLYAVASPYSTKTPFGGGELEGLNLTADQSGYVVFDASDSDCVITKMFTFSGMTLDMGNEQTSNPQGLYFYNVEGYLEYIDYTKAEIKSYLKGENLPASTMKEEGDKLVVTIENLQFSQESNLFAPYSWRESVGPTVITMTKGAGVDDITVDSNAPVKYFNLQGVEVANPEAGQIVIKKQGSKAVKVVVK